MGRWSLVTAERGLVCTTHAMLCVLCCVVLDVYAVSLCQYRLIEKSMKYKNRTMTNNIDK